MGRPPLRNHIALTLNGLQIIVKSIRYRRYHETLEAAKAEHARIAPGLMACCSGIIYGPGCGDFGVPA